MAKVREDVAELAIAGGFEKLADELRKTPEHPTQYIVTTTNPEFSGKTLGVQFTNGRALVNAQSIDERLGRSLEQVAAEFKLLPGYHIEPA